MKKYKIIFATILITLYGTASAGVGYNVGDTPPQKFMDLIKTNLNINGYNPNIKTCVVSFNSINCGYDDHGKKSIIINKPPLKACLFNGYAEKKNYAGGFMVDGTKNSIPYNKCMF